MAEAVVEERQLLKKLRWWDGFVIALATPGFLLGSLGYSVGDLGGWGSVLLWGISAALAFFIMTLYSEMAAMFPEQAGRLSALRARGLAQVLHARRPISRSGTGLPGRWCLPFSACSWARSR